MFYLDTTASERFVKAEEYKEEEPPTEYFPSLPIHSRKKNFKADKTKSKVDEDECNKDYPKAPKMTQDWLMCSADMVCVKGTPQ